jgi:hypothetical protein
LFKFIGFTSSSKQPFYSYVAHDDEQSKLWHEILGHLNFGKMQLLSNMVHGLPPISSSKGVCEGCVLDKHHGEKFEKDKVGMPKNNCSWFIVTCVVLLRLPLYQVLSTSSLSLMITIGKLGYIS